MLVAGKHWTAKGVSGCGGLFCSQPEVPKQTASTGWTQKQQLYTQKCLGVSSGFVSSPLEGEHLFTSLNICIDRMMGLCVFSHIRAVLQKHPVVKNKKKISFFPQCSYCTKDLIWFLSSHKKKCVCDILVVVVLLCKDTVLWDGMWYFLEVVILLCT